MRKKIFSTVALMTAMLVATGCSSDGSPSSTTTTASTSGVVADGHIKGATVFVDLNRNGIKDSDEPMAVTDAEGKYTITFSGKIDPTIPVIAMGGFDVGLNKPFTAKLVAPLMEKTNVTPLTTLAYFYAKSHNTDIKTALTTIAKVVGIDPEKVTEDPEVDVQLQAATLMVQKTVEVIASVEKKDPIEVYQVLANVATPEDKIDTVVEKAPVTESAKRVAVLVINSIENVTKEVTNVSELNQIIVEKIDPLIEVVIAKVPELSTNPTLLTNYVVVNNITDINLSQIPDYYESLKLLAVSATVDDAKKSIAVIRDTIGEITDTGEIDATVEDEITTAYNEIIQPMGLNIKNALSSLNSAIESAGAQFEKEVIDNFKDNLISFKDRISKLVSLIRKKGFTNSYTDSTSYGDNIEFDGEILKINDVPFSVKSDDTSLEVTLQPDNTFTLEENGKYTVNVTKITYTRNPDASALGTVEGTGTIYGTTTDNTIKGDIQLSLTSPNRNESVYDQLINGDMDLVSSGTITIGSNTFNGNITINDGTQQLAGTLNYNGTKIEGNLTLGVSLYELKKNLVNLSLETDEWDNVAVIDGNLVVNKKQQVWKLDNTTKYDINFTAANGEVAHCKVIDTWNKNEFTHQINCDKDIKNLNKPGDVVLVKIGNTSYPISDVSYKCVEENGVDDCNLSYTLDLEGLHTLSINEKGDLVLDGDKQIDISTLSLEVIPYETFGGTNALMTIPGDIKFSGSVNDGNNTLTINSLVINMLGDGESYKALGEGLTLNISSTNQEVKIGSLNIVGTYQDLGYVVSATEGDFFTSYTAIGNINISNIHQDKVSYIEAGNVKAQGVDKDLNILTMNFNNLKYNTETNESYANGSVAYRDLNWIGSAYWNGGGVFQFYSKIERKDYEPFILGLSSNDFSNLSKEGGKANFDVAILRGDYMMAGQLELENMDGNVLGQNGNLIDVNGVYVKFSYSDGKLTLTITDKNGKVLGEYEKGIILYSDGTSETLE
jgi:hypothetical protein